MLRFIREHHLIPAKSCLLVAVSGGPDSVCLLHILARLQDEFNARLHVAHLNHELRGAESEADAEYVSRLASQLGVPATIERRDVKAYRAQHHASLEEAAREVRYTFLAQVAQSIGANRVTTGHTTDDHIETILMHLIRGTGTKGLRGLQPSSLWRSSGGSLTIVRPLLEVSRQETVAYCHSHGLVPRIDASNLSLSPLRNRIRHQLLPLLQGYNPGVTEALLRTARIASDDLAFLENESGRLWDRIVRRQGDTIALSREEFLKLPPALQRHLLRTAIEGLLGDLKDIETRHIEEIMAALTKPAGKQLDLPRGLIFAIGYDQYLLGLDPAALSPFPLLSNEFTLRIPGETLFPGWRVQATVTSDEAQERLKVLPTPSEVPSPPEAIESARCFTAYLDLDKVGEGVVVRHRQQGDRFQPLGMSQSKKLGEFMIDAKVPKAWRQRVPIVCSPQHVLWVVGWRLDDRVKVTENTRRVLLLTFERTSNT